MSEKTMYFQIKIVLRGRHKLTLNENSIIELIYAQQETEGFTPPCLGQETKAEGGDIYTFRVFDVPERVGLNRIADFIMAIFNVGTFDLSNPYISFNIPYSRLEKGSFYSPDKGMSLQEAAEFIDRSVDTVQRLILDGKIPTSRPRQQEKGTRKHVLNPFDLQIYLDSKKVI